MPLIQTANGPIWFADHRDRTSHRPVTLLVHGAGGTHLDWPAEVRRLPEANAIAPDLPGHGRSPGPGRQSVFAYTADMVALLDALHITKAVIAGHSMGGAVALTMALHYPNRVLGLILLGTGAKLGVHPDILDGLKNEVQRAISLITEWRWGGTPQAQEQIRRLGYKRLLEVNPLVLAGDYWASNAFDVRDQLHLIKVPTLIIGGTEDKMTPFRFSEYLHEHIAGSKLVTIEGGGHMMALEQPQAVADAIQSWLAEHIH